MTDSVRSMTGYGSGACESGETRVRVEVRSVNHRYLKVSASVPESLASVQHRVEEKVRERFGRGSFNVTVRFENTDTANGTLVDRERAETLHRELLELHGSLHPDSDPPEISLGGLIQLDGVLRATSQREFDPDQVVEPTEQALATALTALEEMQYREGAHLAGELTGVLDGIARRLDVIEAALPAWAEANRDRYRARLQDFLAGAGQVPDESDVLREVAILAEKADITEEVGRLRGHFEHYRRTLQSGGRVGRKLDFLTQEMFREANTMASKANEYELASEVVDMKADIDRLREQCQNIE